MTGWALWVSPVGAGGWLVCRGLARLGDSASPPTLISPGVPQPRPPRLKKEAIVPASQPHPMGIEFGG